MSFSLPVLYARGTHYEVAYDTGKIFKSRIQAYFAEFEPLHTQFLPFYQTDKGKQICNGWLKVAKAQFPQYLDEVQGLSDGAELPFEQVVLINFRAELSSYLNIEQVPECSTVHINYPDQLIIAHNEDTSPLVKKYGYILSAWIKPNRGQEEHFTAFCYPGTLPGNAFSFNFHGLVFGVNALYPKYIKLEGTARQYLNRALLSAKNTNDVLDILTNEGYGAANGFSVNVGSFNPSTERLLWNYETAPNKDKKESIVNQLVIQPQNKENNKYGHYYHFNMYDHLIVEEIKSHIVSSIHRSKTAAHLPVPHNEQGARQILGNEEDKDYPIYRKPNSTDSGETVATGIFDLLKHTLSIYVDNPTFDATPFLTLPLPV